MAKRMIKKPIHQPFEGSNKSGRFAKITHEMKDSDAFTDLTPSAMGLYLLLKFEYCEKRVNGVVVSNNVDNIIFPYTTYMKYYNSRNKFVADIKMLISHGFVKVKERGRYTRTPNVYQFVGDWQNWKPQSSVDKKCIKKERRNSMESCTE